MRNGDNVLVKSESRSPHFALAKWFVIAQLALVGAHVPGAIFYVNLNNQSPATPYTSWVTSATNIQDAVDVAQAGDTVLVTNGVYAAGGRAVYGAMTNRVAVTNAVLVASVNGPAVTLIVGSIPPWLNGGNGPVRCVYLTDGATLAGFTLTNGSTLASGDYTREMSGGGV